MQLKRKEVSPATEKIEILPVASLSIILSIKRITKMLISLWGCAGWSAILMFANPKDRCSHVEARTIVPTKSDSDVIFCLQMLSKILTCTLHLSKRESIDNLCINPILWIGLIHM